MTNILNQPNAKVLIIIPVYKGLEETQLCIESVLDSLKDHSNAYDLLVINDHSPEDKLTDYLNQLEHPNLKVLINEENLGFVGTVNRGMALRDGRDVILLNSDTEVFNNWVDRLKHCAYLDDRIATVTPYSNNATLCSFPQTAQDNELPFGMSANDIDQIFALSDQDLFFNLPTGVGFCMYIKDQALTELGLFDVEAFKKGYGEECDFCQRAIQHHWINVLCPTTFVYHKGKVSFQDHSNTLSEKAQEVLHQRYPNYHKDVQQHLQEDKNKIHRFTILANLIRTHPLPKILHLHHGLSGGVIRHVHELSDYFQNDCISIYLYPSYKNDQSYLLEIKDFITLEFFLPKHQDDLVHFLKKLNLSLVHYHHFMGFDSSIDQLATQIGCPYDITLHDFYTINANPTLCVQDQFLGFLEANQRDNKSKTTRAIPENLDAKQWRQRFATLFKNARHVLTPSQDCADWFKREFTDLSTKFLAAYPPEYNEINLSDQRQSYVPQTQNLHIVVIGALSPEKGLFLLENITKLNREQKTPLRFSLLGYGSYPLTNLHVTGAYQESEAMDLLKQLKPDLIWFPARWPETYSYTLSYALSSNYPIVAPDIGAFSERLFDVKDCYLLPFDFKEKDYLDWFTHFQKTGEALTLSPLKESPKASQHFFASDYLNGLQNKQTSPLKIKEWEMANLHIYVEASHGWRLKLLKKLVQLRHSKYGLMITKWIPLSVQTKVKRLLSRKPLHEIK